MSCIEVVGVRWERLSYDKNGNITKLKRYGDSDDVDYAFVIDDLQYTYDTTNKNRLLKVTDYSSVPQGFKDDSTGSNNDDPEDDYKYDANGNMTADQNKGIETITYNHLNLPVMIKIPGSGQISYLYNAAGTKVRKIVSTNSGIITDYMAGGFQYHNTKLKHFPHPEGYVTIVDDKFRYVYNYTDHLGNVRLSYSDANANGTIESNEIMEENNYYPFGLKHTAYNTNQSQYVSSAQLNQITLEVMPHYEGDGSYQYKYNGKELQDELGLNMYDYGARNYDPALGRWMNIDPLAEQSRRWTPYNYAYNNPMYFVDPDGMQADDWVYVNDEMKYDSRVTDQASAEELYGSHAKYYDVGTKYTSAQGNSIELGDLGFFKENGDLKLSMDMAGTEGQISQINSSYAGAGLVLGGITADGVTPDPSDLAGIKWIAYAAAGAITGALIMKRDAEIDRILERANDGPPGVQYSLRANTSGDYPIMSSGSSVPTGTMHLNAGDVWKYGETTNPASRYNASDLSGVGAGGVTQYNEFSGTQIQVKAMEKAKIYSYFISNGHLPPGNKIFR